MKQDFIQFAPLFTGLADNERAALAENFVQGTLGANAALFKTGERADGLYLVGTGFVRLVTPGGVNLATLGPGSVLGEDSLFRGVPYDVSVIAVSELEYWKLADSTLRDMILRQPSIGIQLSQNFGSLIAQMQDYLVQQLARTRELANVPRHTLQIVADHLELRRLASGQFLYKAGDPPGGLYLVERGGVEVQEEAEGEKQTAGAGRLLGAIALLTNKPQACDAIAIQETMLWELSAADFQSINARQPGLRRSLGSNVRAHLDRNDQAQAVQRLRQMPIFAELPPHVLQAIAQRMELQHVPAGERVYRIGETGDALYLIETGEIELTAENAVGVVEEIGRIGADGYCGEMSLLTGQIRTEDATATRNTNLWVLCRKDLDNLATRYADIGKALSKGVASRLSDGAFEDEQQLQRFALFAELNAADLRQVAAMLRPMRYRAGEQIFRASTPADKLYLIEKGQVRVQPLVGAAWMLAPGQALGERALLTNQPHNTSVFAETDVDVWTLSKSDFDLLMNRYPTIAIGMSRMLSERLGQLSGQPAVSSQAAPPPTLPPPPSQMAPSPAARRRDAAAGFVEPLPRRRRSFGEWYGSLSGFGKLRFALLVLLIVLLLCISVPFTLFAIINNAGAANRAAAATLNRALNAVYAKGSYEVATGETSLVEKLRLADAQVPPTPTYTPYPTPTPLPTNTPLPTSTPLPTPTPEVVVQYFSQEAAFAAAVAAAGTPTPVTEVQAAAAPARIMDSRLSALGVSVEDAQVGPGQPYWRLIEARWENEQESAGKHHIYVDVLDENGQRLVGQPVTVFWGDGNYTGPIEDKQAPDLGFNYQMYASGYAYNVKVESLPSDIVRGAGMGDLANRFKGIHTSYYLIFQRTTK